MQPNDTVLYNLAQKLQVSDPVLKDLIRKIITQIQILNAEVFESSTIVDEVIDIPGAGAEVPTPTDFAYELIPLGIKFTWERPDPSIILFEIRKGSTWETASRQLVTSTLSAVLEGQSIGTHRYLMKGQTMLGIYSAEEALLDVVIPPLGPISITGSVIDNFVLLSWTVPTSAFRIDYYIVRKNGSEIGRQTGTFIPIFEEAGGTYSYSVQAIDIFGNASSIATRDFVVNQPPDYVLESLFESDFNGTRTNVIRDDTLPSIFANIDATETWNEYSGNGFLSFDDEIAAGYIYYLQPTLPSGEYEEIFDYGAIFDGVIATVSWSYNELVPFMQVDTFLSTSVDNITYTSESAGISIYSASMRYLRVRIEFTALN